MLSHRTEQLERAVDRIQKEEGGLEIEAREIVETPQIFTKAPRVQEGVQMSQALTELFELSDSDNELQDNYIELRSDG